MYIHDCMGQKVVRSGVSSCDSTLPNVYIVVVLYTHVHIIINTIHGYRQDAHEVQWLCGSGGDRDGGPICTIQEEATEEERGGGGRGR